VIPPRADGPEEKQVRRRTGIMLALLLVIFAKPVKKVVKLLIHAAFGFILLFALNYFIHYDAFHLEINLANCIVAGVGGIPGVLLLLGYQYYFK
jgi:inhibitor of the pro-sigma K processing machinery